MTRHPRRGSFRDSSRYNTASDPSLLNRAEPSQVRNFTHHRPLYRITTKSPEAVEGNLSSSIPELEAASAGLTTRPPPMARRLQEGQPSLVLESVQRPKSATVYEGCYPGYGLRYLNLKSVELWSRKFQSYRPEHRRDTQGPFRPPGSHRSSRSDTDLWGSPQPYHALAHTDYTTAFRLLFSPFNNALANRPYSSQLLVSPLARNGFCPGLSNNMMLPSSYDSYVGKLTEDQSAASSQCFRTSFR